MRIERPGRGSGGRQRDDVLGRGGEPIAAVRPAFGPAGAFLLLQAEADVAERVEEDGPPCPSRFQAAMSPALTLPTVQFAGASTAWPPMASSGRSFRLHPAPVSATARNQ